MVKHEHPPIRSRTMRGVFGLGMLQGVVNAGRSSQRRLAWDRQISEEDRKESLRGIRDANSAKALMEEILESKGFYEGPSGPKRREIRNQSFDEILKGEVHVEVFYSESCPICRKVVEMIRGICRSKDFKIKLIPVDESPSGKEWVLESWPHIEVGCHEVTVETLENLAIDSGRIRAVDSRREVRET